jgi:adenylyl- and sulfurtransferase ThiI
MLYLVRYGEIGLKSPQVRRRFRDRLMTNVQDAFVNEGVECITSAEEGRVFVRSDNEEAASNILTRTFGVVSFSPVLETSSSMEEIIQSVLVHFSDDLTDGTSFAVRARRYGTHPYTSQNLASEMGSAVLAKHGGMKVDLKEPNLEIFVEVRENVGYLYRDVVAGPGGLPLGSQGKVLGMVENVRDAVSCWLMMKRGCKVHFAFKKRDELVKVLESWDPRPRSHEIHDEGELEELARRLRAEGLVFGSSMDAIRFKKNEHLAMFYPVVGLTSEEIVALAGKVGLEYDSHEEAQ